MVIAADSSKTVGSPTRAHSGPMSEGMGTGLEIGIEN